MQLACFVPYFTDLTSRRGNLPIQVPKVLPGLPFFPKKDLTFNEPAIPVNGSDFTHFILGQWLAYDSFEIAEIMISVG
jgi:hypothetical protein